MALKIALIGLNRIGASLGLALTRSDRELICVGYDEEPSVANAAKKLGAITRSYLALHRCVRDAQVIVLACPLDEVRENLEQIADHAPVNTVVIDTSPDKTRVAEWAQEILPENKFFTGWTLALNHEYLHDTSMGVEAAIPDLFSNSLIGINDLPGTPEAVLKLSSDLVRIVGATPYLVDSMEIDGLIAMTQELPRLSALALLLATVDSSGWHEARKFASHDYAMATQPVLNVPERKSLGLSLHLNRENAVRLIDDLKRALLHLRRQLEEGDREALQKDIDHAIEQRVLWLEQRRLMKWDSPGHTQRPRPQGPSLLGDWLDSRLQKGKDRT